MFMENKMKIQLELKNSRFWVLLIAAAILIIPGSLFASTGDAQPVSEVDSIIIRGNDYMSAGHPEKAIEEYTSALKYDPKNAGLYLQRGIANGILGMTSESLSDLNNCIAINPNISEAYYSRAKVYEIQDKKDQAIKDYSKAIDLHSK